MSKLGPNGTARKTSSPTRAPQPNALPARALPRSRPPTAPSATPQATPLVYDETAALASLLRSLVGLLAAHDLRPHVDAGHAVLLALGAIVDMVRRYLSAPATHRLVRLDLGANETGLRLVSTEPPAPKPASEPPTPEQQRAAADRDTDGLTADLTTTAAALEHLGQHSPRAAALASGLRALLSPTLSPTQKRLVVDLFETLKHHGQLVDALAVARDEAADLRRKWIDGANREEIRRTLNEVDSCIEHARHPAWKVGDGLNMSAGHITGDASPDGALGQAIALAMLLRAADWHGDSDEGRHVSRAHAAWNSAE